MKPKKLARSGGYAHDAAHQVIALAQRHLRIGFRQVGLHLVLYMPYDVVIVETGDEHGHIDVYDRVLVQVLLKRGVAGYL